ncbi:subtilisin-like protein [Ascodesmis nigricans]|uniref:tripeptidyl-peptidase II n=1 Tax=Ascodesmis nigricans TaxID=341454 RepID=A0A4S2MJ25_9PEZI|nr:subtilisin-like protein [Ascodesmis nigricans]
MHLPCLPLLLSLLPLTLSLSPPTLFSTHLLPAGWYPLPHPPPPSHPLILTLHLLPQDSTPFSTRFTEISSPSSPHYGKYLSREQLQRELAPDPAAVPVVLSWLGEHGIDAQHVVVGHDTVKIPMTVQQAEELLNAEYRVYEREEDGLRLVRALEYSLPVEVGGVVAVVEPTNTFALRRLGHGVHNLRPFEAETETETETETEARATLVGTLERVEVVGNDTAVGAVNSTNSTVPIPIPIPGSVGGLNITACNKSITPECLADLYGFAGYTPTGLGSLGVSGFLDQWAQYSDLDKFLSLYRPDIPPGAGNFSLVSVNGGTNQQHPNDTSKVTEANLDIQYAVGVAWPVNTTYYTVGGRPPFIADLDIHANDSEPYLEFLNYLLSLDQHQLPSVLSTSYGENEQSVPLAYRIHVCTKFRALGARGVSVIFASGDSGPGSSCTTNDGGNQTRFMPQFPAACPWVTSVGATEGVAPERAAAFSSGGFSDTWARPEYQQDAVEAYLENNRAFWERWQPYFNPLGRAFPDVAAQGRAYRVFIQGKQKLVDGTSASAPTFAGVVALVNDARLRRGLGGLGFLNPLLYGHPEVLEDVVTGRSVGCTGMVKGKKMDGAGVVEGAGWEAVVGWDPVTGLGTPKFQELLNIGNERAVFNDTKWCPPKGPVPVEDPKL